MSDPIRFHSPYFALAFAPSAPRLLFLGLESGGRTRRHLDVNLLRSGHGGRILPAHSLQVVSSTAKAITYQGDSAVGKFSWLDARTFTITLQAGVEPLTGDLFTCAFAPDITPPSLWARPESWAPMADPLHGDPFDPQPFTRRYHAPGLVSCPEYGLLRITADHPDVSLRLTLVPDPANAGMNLGHSNLGGHNIRRAFHHGRLEIACTLDEPADSVTLTFTAAPEIFPELPGCDLDEPRWAGFKRHWISNFTLHPPTLSLGDNPILSGLGHLAIHWKADLARFTPPLIPGGDARLGCDSDPESQVGLSIFNFIRSTLEGTFTRQTAPDGKMTGYGWENGACNLIALDAYLDGTGDWAFARRHLPAIERVIQYNLALDQDADGILEAAYHGNHFRDTKTSLNWWDAFAFGHKDAYGNLMYYEAFRRILPVLKKLERTDTANQVSAFLEQFEAGFHPTFYNPKSGLYAGWVSRDGRMHDYAFTFITAMAINAGLVEIGAAREMLQRLLAILEANGYGEFRYGVPGPAIPVHPDDRSDWAPMADWGQYENGGFCGQTAYPFILALYKAGMREDADTILFNMFETFETLPTQSGLTTRFTESWDWRTRDGRPCGYNYLADNYAFLLAAVFM